MNLQPSLRAKLIAAALSLLVIVALNIAKKIGSLGAAAGALEILMALLTVAFAFLGVFRSPVLQLLWGWMACLIAPIAASACVSNFRSPDLIEHMFGALALSIVGYLLLADREVRD